MPADDLAHRRGVGDGRGERADLVERRAERDQAEARDRAVGGLHADHTAQRGGLADRAAGVGAERDRGEARGDRGGGPARGAAGHPGRCRAGCGWDRRPSSPSRSPWRTRPGWSCRPSPRPAAARRVHDGRVVGRAPALEDARRARGRDAPGAEVVLDRDGHAGERPGVADRRPRRRSTAAAAARAWSSVTTLNAWISGSRSAMRARCSSSTSTALRSPARTAAASSSARAVALTAPPPGPAARGTDRPRRRGPRRAPRRGRAARPARRHAARW